MTKTRPPGDHFPPEHVSFIQEDYRRFPVRGLVDQKESFFAGIGLQEKNSGSRFANTSHKKLFSLTQPIRNAIPSSGALPFTCGLVYSAVKHSDHIFPYLKSYLKSERIMCRRILWPDEKFRKRVAEIGLIPYPDAEFSDLKWTTKRKRVAEIEKKRRLKQEYQQQEAQQKRQKTLRDLRSYRTRELLTILPQITQENAVELERAEPHVCEGCHKTVYSVEGRVYHNCSRIIELT